MTNFDATQILELFNKQLLNSEEDGNQQYKINRIKALVREVLDNVNYKEKQYNSELAIGSKIIVEDQYPQVFGIESISIMTDNNFLSDANRTNGIEHDVSITIAGIKFNATLIIKFEEKTVGNRITKISILQIGQNTSFSLNGLKIYENAHPINLPDKNLTQLSVDDLFNIFKYNEAKYRFIGEITNGAISTATVLEVSLTPINNTETNNADTDTGNNTETNTGNNTETNNADTDTGTNTGNNTGTNTKPKTEGKTWTEDYLPHVQFAVVVVIAGLLMAKIAYSGDSEYVLLEKSDNFQDAPQI